VEGRITNTGHARAALLACLALLGGLLAACGGGGSTATTEALSGTINVTVTDGGRPATGLPLRITRLGPKGEHVSSLVTGEQTIHVSPGTFEVTVLGTPPTNGLSATGQKVTVAAYEDVRIPISLNQPHHPPQHKRGSQPNHEKHASEQHHH
jgi:hypothetical protein